jgi:hypothetical protein
LVHQRKARRLMLRRVWWMQSAPPMACRVVIRAMLRRVFPI